MNLKKKNKTGQYGKRLTRCWNRVGSYPGLTVQKPNWWANKILRIITNSTKFSRKINWANWPHIFLLLTEQLWRWYWKKWMCERVAPWLCMELGFPEPSATELWEGNTPMAICIRHGDPLYSLDIKILEDRVGLICPASHLRWLFPSVSLTGS